MIRLLSSCCIAMILTVASTASGQEVVAPKKAAPTPPPVIDAIDAAMQTFVEQGKISGAVTLVGHRGKIVHLGAVGLADIEAQKEMRTFTMFSIASMTKPITATAIMILQDEGKLSVDDNVSKYIPAYKDLKLKDGAAPSREITIRDAITHTSGLAGDQLFDGSLEEAVDQLAERPLAFEPGTKWQYSPGLNVAGRIVEIVSGQSFQAFLQERIFDVGNMTSTTFFPDQKQQRRIATLYGPGEEGESLQAVANRISNPAEVKAPNPSGGLFATARDMFRFYQMVLDGGKFRKQRVVSEDAVAQMTSRQTGDLETGFTPGNCWGLGWCIIREPQGVTEMLSPGTFGHGGAFGTQGWVDPKTQTIYVLMIQRTKMGNSDGSDIRKTFQQTAGEALGL
ncbi:beta-lactamase family protein [Stieleria sp. ICT_E10.1]|uniref:serine hydrolase domain-containing protein n=1 Tax=Stieleria sedimenti TaxID=2976331 RepID=UPI00217F9566|nr:serine hydrolase domain-containing protein [Stieleria sedimenti]MCS7470088.1 beta-lactamase family protein [Stieleria sedimenti]